MLGDFFEDVRVVTDEIDASENGAVETLVGDQGDGNADISPPRDHQIRSCNQAGRKYVWCYRSKRKKS